MAPGWEAIKDNSLGVRFTPQAIVHGFLPDFWCAVLKLAIEVDGSIHLKQASYDNWRTAILRTYGIQVVRFTNNEVFHSRDECVAKIRYVIGQRKQQRERDKSQTKKPKWKR